MGHANDQEVDVVEIERLFLSHPAINDNYLSFHSARESGPHGIRTINDMHGQMEYEAILNLSGAFDISESESERFVAQAMSSGEGKDAALTHPQLTHHPHETISLDQVNYDLKKMFPVT